MMGHTTQAVAVGQLDAPDLLATSGQLDAYLEHLKSERSYSIQTLKAYTDDLKGLMLALKGMNLAQAKVRESDIRHLVAITAKAKISPKTQARRLSCWRGYFDWLAGQGLVQTNPVRAVKAPKAGKRLPKSLAPDQAMSLANHAPDAVFEEMRDKAMIELLYSSGLRVSELQALDRHFANESAPEKYQSTSWLDRGEAQVTVLGKGQKLRTVPVGQAALDAISAWLDFRDQMHGAQAKMLRGPDDQYALFCTLARRRLSVRSIQARVSRLGLAQGINSRVHPHVLRHSFASHVLQSSGDLRAVQEMLGHSNITSTQIYTSLDFQRLAAVYDAAHPRAKKTEGS
jgi:integrase/recombinase XerC